MDPAVNIGVLDSTTLDTGILTGDAAMSEDNTARLTYLRLQSEAAAGDLILTSGYGEQIPQGLTVGYLSEVSLAATGLTLEGVIDLSARPENARQVFVLFSVQRPVGRFLSIVTSWQTNRYHCLIKLS